MGRRIGVIDPIKRGAGRGHQTGKNLHEVRAFVDDDRLFLERGKTGVDKNLYRLRDEIEIANIREIIKK
ncbi:unnamed protein product [marine sediment metagenome]|uniref:Uncharacterized protein n=1 Tax=marine sediment metagenome TaxID=412755 RepID=X1LRG4_9ZZZZ